VALVSRNRKAENRWREREVGRAAKGATLRRLIRSYDGFQAPWP
jgi:hypothetical protein